MASRSASCSAISRAVRGPGRQAVDRLDQRRAHQHGRPETGTAGLVQVVKISDELLDFGQIDQRADAVGVMRLCYFGTGHGEASLGPSPGSVTSTRQGALFTYKTKDIGRV